MNFLELAAEAFKRTTHDHFRKEPKTISQDYHTYIHSPDWEDRKRRYYETHPKRCVICLTYKHIDLHHLSYRNLGNEQDEELVAVCRFHHDMFHAIFGSKLDMFKDWEYFVRYTCSGDRTAEINSRNNVRNS